MELNFNTFLLVIIILGMLAAAYYVIPIYEDYVYYKPMVDDIITNIHQTQSTVADLKQALRDYFSTLPQPPSTMPVDGQDFRMPITF